MAKVTSIVIDTNNLNEIPEFWKTLLGLEERARYDTFLWLGPISENGPSLAFQLVPEDKATKNRLHLDLSVPDRIAFAARIIELGGWQLAEHTIGDFTWNVMADPAGNEFCISEPSH